MTSTETIHTKDGTIGQWHSTEFTRKPTASAIRRISALVLALYICAILCALAHLLFFQHLDGRRLDIDTNIPQSWISPISFLIGLAFRAALCSCLTIAFAQHLWHIMIKSFLSLRAIDRLYSLQWQFFSLFHVDNLRASPVLVAIMCLYWLTPIAVIFPSGALIVQSKPFPETFSAKVPYFDPAYYGNGSLEDALKYSLQPDDFSYEYSTFGGPVSAPNGLLSSAAISLVSDQIFPSPSPCGANCTYSIEFQGPYVKCNQSSFNHTFNGRAILLEIEPFRGSWNNASAGWERPEGIDDMSVLFVPDNFTFRTQMPYAWWIREDTDQNVTFTVSPSTNLDCTPGRANYKVDVNYTSGEATYAVDTQPIDSLIDFWYLGSTEELFNETFLFNKSENGVNNLRATNLWLLIDSLVDTLEGRVVCQSRSDNGTEAMLENVKGPNGETFTSTNALQVYCYLPSSENGTLIAETSFNTRRFARGSEPPEFDITQDLLNEALVNITLSAMNRFQLLSTTTQATRNEWANYYHFATPTRLIVSYFGSLILALLFMVLGFLSLRSNGAAAPTAGLVDMLVLSAKSEAIVGTVKDYSFEHMQHQERKEKLQTLRVRYGDFRDHIGGEKALGLGVEHELKPEDESGKPIT